MTMYRVKWVEDSGLEYSSGGFNSIGQAKQFEEASKPYSWVKSIWIEEATWTRMENE